MSIEKTSSVKRFFPDFHQSSAHQTPFMREAENGVYVDYHAYEQQQLLIEKLQHQIKRVEKIIEDWREHDNRLVYCPEYTDLIMVLHPDCFSTVTKITKPELLQATSSPDDLSKMVSSPHQQFTPDTRGPGSAQQRIDELETMYTEKCHQFQVAQDNAKKAIFVALNSVPPEGWKLVPTSATPSMVNAGAMAARQYMEETGNNSPFVIYRAMIDSAPNLERKL